MSVSNGCCNTYDSSAQCGIGFAVGRAGAAIMALMLTLGMVLCMALTAAPSHAAADGTPPTPKQTGSVSVNGNAMFGSISYDGSVAVMYEEKQDSDSKNSSYVVVSFKDSKVTPITGKGVISPDAKSVFFVDAAGKGLKMLDVSTGKITDLPGDVTGMSVSAATGDLVLLSRGGEGNDSDDKGDVAVYDVAARRLGPITDLVCATEGRCIIPSTDLSRMFVIETAGRTTAGKTASKLWTYDLKTGKQIDAKEISGMPSDAAGPFQVRSSSLGDKAVVVSAYIDSGNKAGARSRSTRMLRLGLDDAKITPLADGAYMTGLPTYRRQIVNPANPSIPYALVIAGADGDITYGVDPLPDGAQSVQVFDVAANKVVRTVPVPAALQGKGVFLGLSDDGQFALQCVMDDTLTWQTVDLATGGMASVQLDLAGDFAENTGSDFEVSGDGSTFVTAKWDTGANATTLKVYATGVGGTVKPAASAGGAWSVAIPGLGGINVWWIIGAVAGLIVLIVVVALLLRGRHARKAGRAGSAAGSAGRGVAAADATGLNGLAPIAQPIQPVTSVTQATPKRPALAAPAPPIIVSPAVPAVRFCTECGTRVTRPDAKFCPGCGHPLNQ